MEFEVVESGVTEIRKLVDEAIKAEALAIASIEYLIQVKVKAGVALAVKKAEVGHGGWIKWIEENLQISPATTNRWIKLSEFAKRKGTDLQNAQTVRQAYILANLLPESEPGMTKGHDEAAYLAPLEKMEAIFEAKIAVLAPNQREEYCVRLRKILVRLEQLEEQAAWAPL